MVHTDARAVMRRLAAPLVALAFFSVAGSASAHEDGSPAEPKPVELQGELRGDLRVDLPATGLLTAVVVGFRLVRDDLEPSACRICDGSYGGSVNPVDQWFRAGLKHGDTKPANVTSYALAFGAAPLAAIALTALATTREHRTHELILDLVAIAEGGLSAMLVTEVLESATLRTRPYVHAIADADARNAVIAETGAFHAFPAGHVVGAFGIAAASGVVASMRRYKLAPVIWGAGLLVGVTTAYTRIAADRHYFTDTVAGAAIGAFVGGSVPLLFHSPRSRHAASVLGRPTFVATPLPHGAAVGVGWAF